MFEDFGDFNGGFNIGQSSDRLLLPDFGVLQRNQCYEKSDNGLDLCKKLSGMGIACDMSIWSKPNPVDLGSRRRTLHGYDQNLNRASSGFLQNTSSHGDLRLLGVQDSPNHMNRSVRSDAFRNSLMFERNRVSPGLATMEGSGGFGGFYPDVTRRGVSLENNPFMFERNRALAAMEASGEMRASRGLAPMEASGAFYPVDSLRGVSLENNPFNGSFIFERNRALAAMEASGEIGALYPENTLRGVSLGNNPLMFQGNRASRTLASMEASREIGENTLRNVSTGNDALMFEGNRVSRALATMELRASNSDLSSMVNIYGSVSLMAKDQFGCRVLQKTVNEGTFLESKAIFLEIISHVFELAMDPFGNYFVQKLLDVCDEEQRTLIVRVLTSNSMELIKICLNTYGYALLSLIILLLIW